LGVGCGVLNDLREKGGFEGSIHMSWIILVKEEEGSRERLHMSLSILNAG
jgi:hypothetical protein